MPNSVYIHIPFCKTKCRYCSFISVTSLGIIDNYIDALINEIRYYYDPKPLKTLYFGGGTPSLLKTESIAKIIKNFKLGENAEITFEINPDDAEINYLKDLKSIGINRLSFGVQTFNDKILKLIGRRHNSKTALRALDNAQIAGFKNISIDLIYGLPEQTTEILKNDLEIVKTSEIQHISTYGLKIEEPSYFYYHSVPVPDEDTQADMYLGVNEFLENIGFMRYEISNFAHKGFESKHNLNYWNNNEYYGFGAAAHGYKDGIRYFNDSNIEKYISCPLVHKNEHKVSPKENLEEEIFLGFRRECGINTEDINEKFNIDFELKYQNILIKYMPKYLIKTDIGYKLTLDGVLLSNNILADFIN